MTKNKAPPKERTGLDNLTEQIDRIWRGLNQKGYATRSKYYDCTIRFCRYYYEQWHGQKFANISGKHIRGYVEYMQNVKHYAPKTITAELSGIRFYYNAAGGRNNLPTNDTLGLEKNVTGVIDRAWLPDEFISAVGLARSMNREDVVIALKSCYSFGFRIHEVCKLRVEQIENAVKYGEISVKGKGGQLRAIPIETDRQKKMITELLEYTRKKGLQPGQYFISDSKKHGVEKEKKSLENWLKNHQKDFLDTERTQKVKDGNKIRSDNLTWHGLRYTYAQNVQGLLSKLGYKNVEKEVSRRLGHDRKQVTFTYLPQVRNHKSN